MKPKGENAYKKLFFLDKDINNLIKLLKTTREILEEKIIPKENLITKTVRTKSMINSVPERLGFNCCRLRFYIDFTIVASKYDDEVTLNGSIVYGVNRTLCFNELHESGNKKDGPSNKCTSCYRTDRCDNLEDKPLVAFLVNKQGLIEARGTLEGEWWIEKKGGAKMIKVLKEMHYRALDHIWGNALDWTNESILP